MTTILSSNPIVQLAAERMITCVLAGIAIPPIASLVLWLTACRSSGTRFIVWFSSLLVIAGLSLAACTEAASGPVVSRTPHFILPAYWVSYALALWAAISLIGIVKIVSGLWRVHSLRRRCAELRDFDSRVAGTIEDFHSVRRVNLYVSDELRVPTAIGYFQPAVLIPRWAITDLSGAELNAVVLHELGHLRRWDDWTNLAQKILRALLFFHPAVWWLDSRLSLEREIACDDLVLANTSDARSYAECLVSVAEKSVLRTGLALAVAAVGRVRQTAIRLARILDPNRLVETRVSRVAVAMVSAVSVAALILLPHMPTLVVFQNGSRVSVAAAQGSSSNVSDHVPISMRITEAAAHRMRAVAVPAVMRTTVSSSRALPEQKAKTSRIVQKRAGSPTPLLLRTSIGKNENQSLTPALLLVIQTEQYDSAGSSDWNVQIWRFVLLPEKTSTNPSISKSI